MKHRKYYAKKLTKREKAVRIKSFLLTILILSIAFAGYWGYMSYWPIYTHAAIAIERPKIDARTLPDHVWDILTEEYNLTLTEKIKALSIIDCESKWNPYAINKNLDGSYDIGLWQLNEKYHDITRECGFDVYCSTRYAMDKIYLPQKNWDAWICNW